MEDQNNQPIVFNEIPKISLTVSKINGITIEMPTCQPKELEHSFKTLDGLIKRVNKLNKIGISKKLDGYIK